MKNLGYHTDSIMHRLNGRIEEKAEYWKITTPSNPTYYWGNFLLFKNPPLDDSFPVWMRFSEKEFGLKVAHRTFGWDTSELGDIVDFETQGFTYNPCTVLSLKKLYSPPMPASIDVSIRKIQTDADWRDIIESQIEIGIESYKSQGFETFKTRQMQAYRTHAEMGHGNWWGAYNHDGQLVGNLGLYFDRTHEIGRFQSVETRSKFRKKGVCSSLLYHVSKTAMDKDKISDLVIVTEVDNPAQNVYNSIGFEACSFQHGLCWTNHN